MIMYIARTFMVHVSLHWSEQGVDDLAVWGFVVKYASSVYNHAQSSSWVLLHWNYSPRQRLITEIYHCHMYGAALCLSLTPSFKTERRC
eukprot:CCRYP_020734-RA/>CCRYP_020734-RA protein AED:0.26 eAED:0.26 QI:0/-1/0/1/-1/0/1/0/88